MNQFNDEPRLGLIALARPTFDTVLAAEKATQVRMQFQKAGLAPLGPEELVMSLEAAQEAGREMADLQPDLLVVFQASFADSTMVLALADAVDAPLLLWAVPEDRVGGRLRLNSLCGINLGAHALTRAGYNYDYVYGDPDDAAVLRRVMVAAQAGRVRRLLRSARIGVIGEYPAGFDSCQYDAPTLRQRLGVEVAPIDLARTFERVREAETGAVDAVLIDLQKKMDGLADMDEQALRGTLSTYVTLNQAAGNEQLHGLAVRCWPEFFTELGCAACGAMSLLSDQGTPCSCEADVNGTITQLILQWISGEPAFGADVVAMDADEDVVILWHCGLAPLSMADPDHRVGATIHSNRQLPLLMEFPLKPGRVTVARLSEASGELRLVIGSGEMVQAPPSFTGTTGTLRFDRPATAVLDTILKQGLEHHISITYGDHTATLEALADMLGLPILQLSQEVC